jgi:hypothetical protein
METVVGKAERSHNVLLIIDVQVGLVKTEIRAGVLSRIETLLSRARACGDQPHSGRRMRGPDESRL